MDMNACADAKTRALRYFAGLALLVCAQLAMKFSFAQIDNRYVALLLMIFYLALGGCGFVLMWSAKDKGPLGVTRLGLSGPTQDSVQPLQP
jgi:hypothetical protein